MVLESSFILGPVTLKMFTLGTFGRSGIDQPWILVIDRLVCIADAESFVLRC